MDNQLDVLCKKFIQNRDIIKTTFKWDSNYMFPICSSIFIGKGITPDKDMLIKCRQLLKESTSFFSNFNSFLRPVVVSTLATYDEPHIILERSLEIYDMLKKEFKASDYLVLSSIMLADFKLTNEQYSNIIHKSREIYKLQKSIHPLLTSQEDTTFCVLSALSNATPKYSNQLAEEGYMLLKPYFSSANAVQSLAHVLSLYPGTSKEKVEKVLSLYNILRDKGYKYGKGYDLASLGVLAMLPMDTDILLEDIICIDTFLGTQKGYGLFGFSKCNKLMHCAMILCSFYLEQSETNSLDMAITSPILSLVIAQQSTVMISCITACAAASSASTN